MPGRVDRLGCAPTSGVLWLGRNLARFDPVQAGPGVFPALLKKLKLPQPAQDVSHIQYFSRLVEVWY